MEGGALLRSLIVVGEVLASVKCTCTIHARTFLDLGKGLIICGILLVVSPDILGSDVRKADGLVDALMFLQTKLVRLPLSTDVTVRHCATAESGSGIARVIPIVRRALALFPERPLETLVGR